MQTNNPANGAVNQQNQNGGLMKVMGGIIRMMVIYFAINYFFSSKSTTPKQTILPNSNPNDPNQPISTQPIDQNKILLPHRPLFPKGQALTLRIFLSENETLDFINNESLKPVFKEDIFHEWKEGTKGKNLTIEYDQKLWNNGTYFAHIFLSKKNSHWNPSQPNFHPINTLYKRKELVKYITIKKNKKINLMSDNKNVEPTETTETNPEKNLPISHWIPTLYLNLVDSHTAYSQGAIPPPILPQFEFYDLYGTKFKKEESPFFDEKRGQDYYPILFINEFWLMQDHLIPINDTLKNLNLYVEFSSLSEIKWNLYVQFDMAMDMQKNLGSMVDSEKDDFKRMIIETNPYLLGATMIVSMLHMIFDFLAFKNDISFWKNNKSMEGLSVRTIFFNAVSQLIIFLYLLDNETSWMILISSGVGVAIEFWKIQKSVNVKIDTSGSIPKIKFEDKDSYVSKTKEYDQLAMKYLGWLLYPLLIGYSIYSLYYETHKSWYSWILTSLVGAIYTFGFIMMTPQLFINYKLKSVAHLPWKTLIYKALNTFIDDMFAFIIKMPTLHRLSCFRDDLIFFIYIYQRWIYRVDKTRVNEFGQGGEEPETTTSTSSTSTSTSTQKSLESKKNE